MCLYVSIYRKQVAHNWISQSQFKQDSVKHTKVQFPLVTSVELMERMSRSLQLFLVSIVLLTCVDIGATQDDGEYLK